MGNNVCDPLDQARAGGVLPERNMGPHLIIIGGVFHKDSSKVLRVERDQMIRALTPDRSNQAFSISVLPGRAYEVGWSRIPMGRTRALKSPANARSLSRMRYLGAVSQGNDSVIWRASHSAVGCSVTANPNSFRRRWPRTRHTKSRRKAIVGTTKRSRDAISFP